VWPTAERMAWAASPARPFRAAAEVTVGLRVPDHGFDAGPASAFAFDDAEDSASLSRDEDAPRVQRIMAANATCSRCIA